MFLRKSTTLKFLIVVPLAVLFYCEWFAFVIQPLLWQGLACQREESCTKILFIADPQIQGELAVPPPLSWLFNWDSDRYLHSTFSVVLKHFKPDILVYLGDLMDEGSVSSMGQFHGYVKRLADIYDVHYSVVQVWLPGDNDIGGEQEPVKPEKVAAFNQVFNQPSVITYRNITFYKVNSVMYKVPQRPDVADPNVKIAVAHYPVLSKDVYGKQVHESIHADVYFCAHDHESKYTKQNRQFSQKQTHPLPPGAPVLDVPLDGEWLYEVYVPTCSYRMGTSKIGYGAAILEKNRGLRYTVLWSPQRFPQLAAYLVLAVVVALYACCFCVVRLIARLPRLSKTNDVLPLLHRH